MNISIQAKNARNNKVKIYTNHKLIKTIIFTSSFGESSEIEDTNELRILAFDSSMGNITLFLRYLLISFIDMIISFLAPFDFKTCFCMEHILSCEGQENIELVIDFKNEEATEKNCKIVTKRKGVYINILIGIWNIVVLLAIFTGIGFAIAGIFR